ncbi:MAG: histidinol-phosphate aminotransferase [Myxococcota bacterium]|jgi:histidinol-phosphate aminotransferase
MSELWSDLVRRLSPYVPGEQPKTPNLVKLNTNENPYPPSPKAQEVLGGDIASTLRLYPDPNSAALKDAIANSYRRYNLERDHVFVGNGSDEVLALSFMAFFLGKGPLQLPDISYSFYPVYCKLFDIDCEVVPLAQDYSIDLQPYRNGTGGIIFPNPNAPTGIGTPLEQIESLVADVPNRVVVVDEAYVDFGAETAVALVDKYPNVLVIQTLSKSRSLAGLRVGFAIGDPQLIAGLDRVKNSFNSYPIDRLAEQVAVAALGDDAYFRECCDKIISVRARTNGQLAALGFDVLPSQANFVFARHRAIPASRLFQGLRDRDILVRHFEQDRIDQFLRITIGTAEEMQQLVRALKELIQSS